MVVLLEVKGIFSDSIFFLYKSEDRPFSQLGLSCCRQRYQPICSEIEAQFVVDLVQVHGECNPNAPEKVLGPVLQFGLDFSANPGTYYKHEKAL